MPDYVFNTTALSNFGAVGRLDLLASRYGGNAHTTAEVVDELRRGVKAGYAHLGPLLKEIEDLGHNAWIDVLMPESVEEHLLRADFDDRLDAGEASCLALAVRRGLTFVTDDLAARQLAMDRGVLVTGTLGILVALVRERSLSLVEANTMLADMIRQRYRSPVDRLDELI